MSNYDTMPEPPPIDYDDWGRPPDDYDYLPDYDPYLPDDLSPSVLDGFIPDDYVPEDRGQFPDMPPLSQDGLQGFEMPEPADEGWSWHDARLIGVDRGEEVEGGRYEVGAIDLYADADTGDLGGIYLPIAAFSDEVPAAAFYHDLQAQIHEASLASYQVPGFAEARAFEMNAEPETWRGAEPAEYAAFEYLRDLETFDPALADDPPEEALDPLIQTAIELGGVARAVEPEIEPEPVVDESAFQALSAIGVQAENFDPNADPPPFYDAETGTAYWIGVFQPDKDDRENCVTSILSLGRNPETGEMEAQLAPCVPGDWDKAYTSAEYLIQVAQKGGIEQVFDTAEGMALATDQREFWETERGGGAGTGGHPRNRRLQSRDLGGGTVSEPVIRDYSFTVRLSAEERAQLEALAAQWNLDKSATVRRALQMALTERQRLPQSGRFVVVQTEDVTFPVRLSGKAANDR